MRKLSLKRLVCFIQTYYIFYLPYLDFKLAAYGVKKGGLGGLFAGGMPLPRKTTSTDQASVSPVKHEHEVFQIIAIPNYY
jgi:hypothetical protein